MSWSAEELSSDALPINGFEHYQVPPQTTHVIQPRKLFHAHYFTPSTHNISRTNGFGHYQVQPHTTHIIQYAMHVILNTTHILVNTNTHTHTHTHSHTHTPTPPGKRLPAAVLIHGRLRTGPTL